MGCLPRFLEPSARRTAHAVLDAFLNAVIDIPLVASLLRHAHACGEAEIAVDPSEGLLAAGAGGIEEGNPRVRDDTSADRRYSWTAILHTFACATLGIRIPHSRAWIGSEGFGIRLAPPGMFVGQFDLATLRGGVVKIIPCRHVAPARSPVANWAVLDASFGAPPDVPL